MFADFQKRAGLYIALAYCAAVMLAIWVCDTWTIEATTRLFGPFWGTGQMRDIENPPELTNAIANYFSASLVLSFVLARFATMLNPGIGRWQTLSTALSSGVVTLLVYKWFLAKPLGDYFLRVTPIASSAWILIALAVGSLLQFSRKHRLVARV